MMMKKKYHHIIIEITMIHPLMMTDIDFEF